MQAGERAGKIRSMIKDIATQRKLAHQLKRAQSPADYIDIIEAIDDLPATTNLAELRNQAVIAKANRVRESLAVLYEGRNERLAR